MHVSFLLSAPPLWVGVALRPLPGSWGRLWASSLGFPAWVPWGGRLVRLWVRVGVAGAPPSLSAPVEARPFPPWSLARPLGFRVDAGITFSVDDDTSIIRSDLEPCLAKCWAQGFSLLDNEVQFLV